MEQSSIIKGRHPYDVVLKHLDKFIEKYVICKFCRYPELRMFIEGKDLKSTCNSCGKTQTHDANHKAGKALVNHIKSGGEQKVDITKKDKKGLNMNDELQEQNENSDKESSENQDAEKEDVKKKDKKDKKEKKEKKDKKKKEDSDELEGEVSDLEEDASYESRRIRKYQLNQKKLFL